MSREEDLESLNDFVLDIAGESMGVSMITRTAVIYEYIDNTGKLKHGIIHEKNISHEEASTLVMALFRSMVVALRDGTYEDEFDIDLDIYDEDYDEEDDEDDDSDNNS